MLNRVRNVFIAAAVALVAVVSFTAFSSPSQNVDCATYPYGTPTCEDYLGGKVRAELARRFVIVPPIPNSELGLAVMGLCRESKIPAEIEPKLAYIKGAVKDVAGGFCG